MEKKLSAQSIARIDETIRRFVAAWENLKATWERVDTPEDMDKAFYEFVDIWLATDRSVDQETHAHSLEYWKDPELETVRQAIIPLQVRLGKIDDPERKRQGIARLQQALEDMSF
jgi:hypothetical protein